MIVKAEKIFAVYSWAGCAPPGNESTVGYILGCCMAILAAVICLLITIRRWPSIEKRVEAARCPLAPALVEEIVEEAAEHLDDDYCSIM